MNMEVIGIRELSLDEWEYVSGGFGCTGGDPPDLSVGALTDQQLLGIARDLFGTPSSTLVWGPEIQFSVQPTADGTGAEWCGTDLTGDPANSEPICLGNGVALNGEFPAGAPPTTSGDTTGTGHEPYPIYLPATPPPA